MKKTFATFSFILFSLTAFADSSVNLKLVGNVPKKLDISIDNTLATLDLSSNKSDYKIATLTEKSNSNNGYKIKISSLNLGKLQRSGGVEKFSYDLKYGTIALDLSSADGASLSNSSYGVLTTSKDLTISYTGISSDRMVEGSYEDTLTFQIEAN